AGRPTATIVWPLARGPAGCAQKWPPGPLSRSDIVGHQRALPGNIPTGPPPWPPGPVALLPGAWVGGVGGVARFPGAGVGNWQSGNAAWRAVWPGGPVAAIVAAGPNRWHGGPVAPWPPGCLFGSPARPGRRMRWRLARWQGSPAQGV